MLNAIIRLSLQYRPLIVFLTLAALVYGSYVATTLPIDVLPDIDRPRVVIITECPGYAPEDVETLVTFPLEAALNGSTGVESIRSQSGPSVSVITINFDWGTNIYTARQIVQERLNTSSMPKGIHPQLTPISSLLGQILFIGLTYKEGPNGGVLSPVPNTDYLAELSHNPTKSETLLTIWNPRDQRRKVLPVSEWQVVPVSANTIALSWGPSSIVAASPEPNSPTTSWSSPNTSTLRSETADGHHFTAPSENIPLEKEGLEFRATVPVNGLDRKIVIHPPTKRQMKLRTIADWIVRLRLLKVKGIAQVVSMGGGRKQYQALVNPTALAAYKIPLEDVAAALAESNEFGSGGWLNRGDKEERVRFDGKLGITPEQVLARLRNVPVKTTKHASVKLGQVAKVVEGPQPKRGDASVNGKPGVVLMVTRQPSGDTRAITAKCLEALDELQYTLPAHIEVNPNLFQMKNFIDLGVFNVVEAIILGGVLVLIILFLFLMNFRTTFISLAAIPLSLAITAIVFKVVGWFSSVPLTINVMTLGGIAVAIGELVDDAIVDVENIYRRLRENNTSANPRPVVKIIYEASLEVRSAIVLGTILVILVFLPLFFLPGLEGRLFVPLGVAYIVSILASLLVSLSVTPVMSYYLLPKARSTQHTRDGFVLRFLKWLARYLIWFSMAFPRTILIVSWALVMASVWALMQIGTDFLPPFDEGSVQVNVSLPPGSSLKASNEVSSQVDNKFLEMRKSDDNPDGFILDFVRRTGRAELDEHAEPVSNTEYILTIDPKAKQDREELLEIVLHELEEMKLGGNVEAEQPLAHLISHMVSGVTTQIAIRVYGDDLSKLKTTAEQIKAAISDVPGIAPPVVEGQQLTNELHIRPKWEEASLKGIRSKQLANVVRMAMYGDVVSEVVEKQRRFDLLVRIADPYRSDPEEIRRLYLKTPNPHHEDITLGSIAEMYPGIGPNTVNRDNVRRRIVVRVNTLGRDLGSTVEEIKQHVREDVKLPDGYFVEYGGQFESQQRATYVIAILALISAVAMFVLLYMMYPSWRIVLQILNALPTAFIGGVVALVLTAQTLTVAAMVGFISLGGIAVRNGILLVSHYLHLMKHEDESFTQNMILRGSLERLAPVLMTALTAIIALVPLVVGGQEPGREILYPVATVILGGLITSTLCEFLMRPGLFWWLTEADARRLTTRNKTEELSEGNPET
ncbi:MAG: efflux RND transporter permease subunit [Gemmataceae bacterium]